MSQQLPRFAQRQTLLNHPSRGCVARIMQPKVCVSKAGQLLCGSKGTLNRLKSEKQIVRLLTLAQFAKFIRKPIGHVELTLAAPFTLVGDRRDAVLLKVNVFNHESVHLTTAESGIKGKEQEWFQVLTLAGTSGNQSFPFFFGCDSLTWLLFGKVDQRIALSEWITRKPLVLHGDCENAPEQREFTMHRRYGARPEFTDVFLPCPFLYFNGSAEPQSFECRNVAIRDFSRSAPEVLSQDVELSLHVAIAPQTGFLDTVLIVLSWYCVLALVVIRQLLERERRSVYGSLVALLVKFSEHLRNMASRLAARARQGFALALVSLPFGIGPSNAAIKRPGLVTVKRSCSLSSHSQVHIQVHVPAAQQVTRVPKGLQDYTMINTSSCGKIRGNMRLPSNLKSAGCGLLISGSQVRALLGSLLLLSKSSQSQHNQNPGTRMAGTFEEGSAHAN